MKLKEKIGQLLVVGLPGGEVTERDRAFIQEVRPGGFILFERNAGSPGQLWDLCQSLLSVGRSELGPPFILIDHEGGRVQRLPKPFTHFPPQALFGKAGDPALTEASFFAASLELSAVGVNVNLSPVLDLRTNRRNRVIGDRSFGQEPHLAAELGAAAVRGILKAGLLAVGKHFPGHGGTAGDSHVELPRSRVGRKTLLSRELVPFRACLEAGLSALMAAHVLFSALDPRHPATLSKKVLTGLLRGEVGFQGLILTDDLLMGAIAKHYALPEAALLSLKAGADLLLLCHGEEAPREVADGLCAALREGRLPKARLEESLARIRREKLRIMGSEGLPGRDEGPRVGHPLSRIGCEAHRRLAEEVLRRAEKENLIREGRG